MHARSLVAGTNRSSRLVHGLCVGGGTIRHTNGNIAKPREGSSKSFAAAVAPWYLQQHPRGEKNTTNTNHDQSNGVGQEGGREEIREKG